MQDEVRFEALQSRGFHVEPTCLRHGKRRETLWGSEGETVMEFDERKTAQIAAYFLQCGEGTMAILKLMKLLYLAERESLRLYGMPMSGDPLVSMNHGPVLSKTYDLIKKSTAVDTSEDGWSSWILRKNDHDLALARSIGNDDFDEFSKADLDILKSIWDRFGQYDEWEIRDYTHKLKEWENPHGTSLPIEYRTIFLALEYPEDQAQELVEQLEEEAAINRIFRSL